MDFDGRHVVVTGGTGVLGRAVVAQLIDAGAVCHLPCRRQQDVAALFGSHPRLTLHPDLELTDAGQVEGFFTGLPGLWASVHLAGGFFFGALKDAEDTVLRQQMETNFITCALCCRAAIRAFARSLAGSTGGRIVNVAARPAIEWRSGANMTAYTASKAAVAALTTALAEEVVKDGILVNAVAPSILDTPANRKAMPKADFTTWPKVEEVARTILFLASPANQATRGAIVSVYGQT